jgi:hypothetical protein
MRKVFTPVFLLALVGCAAVTTPKPQRPVDAATVTTGTGSVGTNVVAPKPLMAGRAGVPVLTGKDHTPVMLRR